MAESPNLTDEQLAKVRAILDSTRASLDAFAQGDKKLLHHARRHIMVKLQYEERGTPMDRKALKMSLMVKQGGNCALCNEAVPFKESELDRRSAIDGYTEENCRVVHHQCHRKSQHERNYK